MKLRAIAIKTNPKPARRRKKKIKARRHAPTEHRQHFLVQGLSTDRRFFYLRAGGKWKTGTKGAHRFSNVKAASDALQLHHKKRPRSIYAAQVVPC